VRDRLIADWLTKAGERGGLDVAFAQLLLSEHHEILRFGHGPHEVGKDIISIDPSGKLNAFQIKQGDVDLKAFQEIQSQVTVLVEAAVSHPHAKAAQLHSPFLVTTGEFSMPVISWVKELNISWKRRKFRPLGLISGRELLPRFAKLSADFWPEDPPKVRDFLTLYLAEGRGDIDVPAFAQFLRDLLPTERKAKSMAVRRISAVNLFASYLLQPFEREADHWSCFLGWIVTAAHIGWFAQKQSLSPANWCDAFRLAHDHAVVCLERLAA
jgi:hypothetical protein